MLQFFLSSWRSGFRSRVFLAIFFLGMLLVVVAYLSASFSPRQPRTIALDIGLSGIRFSLVLFGVMLIQELVGREIERRSVAFCVTYPVSRTSYLFGRYLGSMALSGVAALILGMLLWLAVMASGGHYEQQFRVDLGLPFWISLMGIWIDVAVVTAFTLWVATLSTVSMLPLSLGVLFAIAGRSLGPVFDYVATGADGQTDLVTHYGPILGMVRSFVPDLSRLDWRAWPMYGTPPDPEALWLGVAMAIAYVGVMLAMSAHVFMRREFS